MASWRGYGNLLLDRTKYEGDRIDTDQIRIMRIDRVDHGEFESILLAHETDIVQGDTQRKEWAH